MVKRAAWLSITPEPERELPGAVATLVRGARAGDDAVAHEVARIERLVLHGSQRGWNQYLHRVVRLIESRLQDPDPDVARARVLAARVIANHHNLLVALPGSGAQRTEADRRRLARLLATRNEDQP
jgi:uncharacterized caspase-like protein